jgi:predicted nucleotidyltransferase component of viral defense system
MDMLIKLQKERIFEQYILAGGTALSLQIGHRKSVDLDFFTSGRLNSENILKYMEINFYNNYEIFRNDFDNILQISANKINLDFVSTPAIVIEEPVRAEGVRMYGLRDIAAMKLRAIGNGRYLAKDYIDICFLLKSIPLKTMFEDYKVKYGCTDIMNVKKALAESRKINPFLWEKVDMVRNDVFISDVSRILDQELLKYNKESGVKSHRVRLPKRGKGGGEDYEPGR